MLEAFLYGFILAIGLITPLGIQNVFIFNQGASQKRLLQAMPTVLTAFTCDTALILISVLGVSIAVLELPGLKTALFIFAFFFLLYVGWMTWNNKLSSFKKKDKPLSLKRQIALTASFSLINPHAIIDTLAIIGTNALHFSGHAKWAYTTACILTSGTWFLTLAIAGHHFHRLDKTGNGLIIVNKLSALIIWGVATYIGWQLLR